MPKKRGLIHTKSEDQRFNWIDTAVADVGSTRRARLAVKYDGVLGPPPPWFTTDTQNAFLTARNRLLDKGGFDGKGYTPEALYRLIARVIEEDKIAIAHPRQALNRGTFLVPPKDREDLQTLAGLWNLFQQGELKGTPLLLGAFLQGRVEQGQNYSAQQAHKARKPRGRVGDGRIRMNDLVKRIVRSHPDDSTKELWAKFPNVLRDCQLDPEWIKDKIEYNFRDKRKRISPGRFKNIVSALRVNNSR
ncbi:MAG: hypothetical protein NDI90_11240 [Nitrospira sp. BO4]|jgi:hypothetical protein|nr:hypothetical protein [Nitrospira sp. BO4]